MSSLPYFFDWLFVLEWFSMVPFFLIFFSGRELKLRKAFLYGFLNHFVKSVIVLTWFKELLTMSEVNVPHVLMLFVVFLGDVVLSALQALPFGICGIIIALIVKKGRFIALNLLFIAVFYTFTELFNTIIEQIDFLGLIGFPWVVNYITQHKFTYGIQSSSLFGAHFITFLMILVNGIIAYAICAENKKRIISLASAATLFTSNCVFGIITLEDHNDGVAIPVAVYQDNVSSYSKWSCSSVDMCDIFVSDMQEYFESGKKADIILMSETVFTTYISSDSSRSTPSGKYIYDSLCKFTDKYDTTVICGGFYYDDAGDYNSLLIFENGQLHDTVYKKRTLVPFGEYLPYEDFLIKVAPFLENFNLSGNSLTPGNDANVFDTKKVTVGGLVCYDSIFYYNADESCDNGAEIIAVSTNDSWYNDSAAIFQHYAHSAFRAIENHRYVIRSASTGISGIIDSNGRTITSSGLFEKTVVSGNIYINNDTTLFSKIGYSYLYVLVVLGIVYLTAFSIIGFKKTKKYNN